jgi:hypothetical protein
LTESPFRQIRPAGHAPEMIAATNHNRIVEGECVMKMFSGFHFAGTLAFFLLLAVPAFGQFEVSPDHFDGPTSPNIKRNASVKTLGNKTRSQHGAATAKAGTAESQTSAEITQVRKPQPGTGAAPNTTPTMKKTSNTNQHHGTSKSSRTTAQAGPSLKAQVLPGRRE